MEKKAQFSKGKKITALILMMLSMNTIYVLPYLSYQFYTPLQEAMGLIGREADYGRLLNLYGIANVLLYLPGGWVADRFDAKKLLVFSMVATGALGIWESFFPSYALLTVIYIMFAVTTVLTYWSSSVKCINIIAGDEQGGMFGMLEAGRGVVGILITSLFVFLYTKFQSMFGVVFSCGVIMVLVGVALAIFMPNTAQEGASNTTLAASMKAYGKAFSNPTTYLLAGMIFTGSLVLAACSYFAPYLERVIEVDQNTVLIFQNYNRLICQIVAAGLAAFLASKMGRSTRPIIYAGILLLISCIVLCFFPGQAGMMIPVLIIMILVTIGVCVYRALYYAVVDESGCPTNTVGSIIGIASILGFCPDMFFTTLCGSWLDKFGNDAFKMIFGCCIAASVLGLVCAIISDRRIVKYRASLPKAEE